MTDEAVVLFGWSAEVVTAWAAVGTAAIAFLAALFAGWQVLEARNVRREQAQPYVVVDIEQSPHGVEVLELVIQNVGLTMARDIQFKFTPPLSSALKDEGGNFEQWPAFKDGIRSLAPRKTLRFMFDIGHRRKAAGLQNKYDVVVSCKDARGRPVPDAAYVIDLGMYFDGPTFHVTKTIHHVGQQLQALNSLLRLWGGSGALNVSVIDGARQQRDEGASWEELARESRTVDPEAVNEDGVDRTEDDAPEREGMP